MRTMYSRVFVHSRHVRRRRDRYVSHGGGPGTRADRPAANTVVGGAGRNRGTYRYIILLLLLLLLLYGTHREEGLGPGENNWFWSGDFSILYIKKIIIVECKTLYCILLLLGFALFPDPSDWIENTAAIMYGRISQSRNLRGVWMCLAPRIFGI